MIGIALLVLDPAARAIGIFRRDKARHRRVGIGTAQPKQPGLLVIDQHDALPIRPINRSLSQFLAGEAGRRQTGLRQARLGKESAQMAQFITRQVFAMRSAKRQMRIADGNVIAAAMALAGAADGVKQREDIVPLHIVRRGMPEDTGKSLAMMAVQMDAGHDHTDFHGRPPPLKQEALSRRCRDHPL